jgi:hypothetical protein
MHVSMLTKALFMKFVHSMVKERVVQQRFEEFLDVLMHIPDFLILSFQRFCV